MFRKRHSKSSDDAPATLPRQKVSHLYTKNINQLSTTTEISVLRILSFLLDQLMRYEAVVLSGGEETDYSSGDETLHPHPPLSDREVSPCLSYMPHYYIHYISSLVEINREQNQKVCFYC